MEYRVFSFGCWRRKNHDIKTLLLLLSLRPKITWAAGTTPAYSTLPCPLYHCLPTLPCPALPALPLFSHSNLPCPLYHCLPTLPCPALPCPLYGHPLTLPPAVDTPSAAARSCSPLPTHPALPCPLYLPCPAHSTVAAYSAACCRHSIS